MVAKKRTLTPEQEVKQLRAKNKKLQSAVSKTIKQVQVLNKQVSTIQAIVWGS